jgi:hypothetical protein
MEARTDGCLLVIDGKETFAIFEVKPPGVRGGDLAIQMQESAQMVSWIFHDKKNL